jgi:PIN domain nuclease of toxin-antitoxin system
MNYLLDTHVLLWYIDGNPALPVAIKTIIQGTESTKFVSIASLWEIAIKTSKGKLVLTRPFETLPDYIQANGFFMLPVHPEHLFRIADLPFHHGDPFDRLLIAQAISEKLTIISADKEFRSYPVTVTW